VDVFSRATPPTDDNCCLFSWIRSAQFRQSGDVTVKALGGQVATAQQKQGQKRPKVFGCAQIISLLNTEQKPLDPTTHSAANA
jgi:hypothetical protein